MEVQEIIRYGKDLEKASKSPDSSGALLKMLDELKDGVKASREVLKTTNIGAKVNKLRAYKDQQVARQAQELVDKWKKDLGPRTEAAKASTNGSSNGNANANTNTPPTEKGSGSQELATKRKSSIAPDQRNTKTDEVDIKQTGDDIRDNCIKLMYDGMAFMSEESSSQILKIAISIESAAHARMGLSDTYKAKMRSLFQNLKNKNNPQLRQRVASGNIKADAFVQMTAEQLKSPERRAEDAAIRSENLNMAMSAENVKSISTMFTCGKCKQKKVAYSQAQTRSADEPMTTFCECTVCGNRWKFS